MLVVLVGGDTLVRGDASLRSADAALRSAEAPVIAGVRYSVSATVERRKRSWSIVVTFHADATDGREHLVDSHPLDAIVSVERGLSELFHPLPIEWSTRLKPHVLRPGVSLVFSKTFNVQDAREPSWIELSLVIPGAQSTRRFATVEVLPAQRGVPSVRVMYERE